MRRHRVIIFAVFAATASVGCASPAPKVEVPAPVSTNPNERAVFRAIVQDLENYSRLPGTVAELSIVGKPNDPVAATVSDEHGNFAFSGLPAGTYLLRVGRAGYTEQRMRITVKPDDDKPLDIRLRKIATRCVPSRYHTLECP
jgi:hypothetical protein